MDKKPNKRGGKRIAGPGKKIGRPRLANPKTSVFSVSVTANELAELKSRDAKVWAREVLLAAARRKG